MNIVDKIDDLRRSVEHLVEMSVTEFEWRSNRPLPVNPLVTIELLQAARNAEIKMARVMEHARLLHNRTHKKKT